MNLLETWVASPVAGAVGWALVHSLWEGAIVAAALGAALLALRSPRARYAAACVAMAATLGGLLVTFVRVMPESAHGMAATGKPAFPAWRVGSGVDFAGPSNGGLAAAVPWLAPVWMAGVWIFCCWNVAGWTMANRMRRRGVCTAPEEWRKELARLSARVRVSRPVKLMESCLADVPVVIGHFRPAILMPAGLLTGLPAGQIEAILLHELAHIRRYDYLVNLLQRAVEGLLFYHPAVWWISRVIRAERENCCDDVVVDMCGNAREYAVALAALEENRWPGREPALAATGGSLVKRIDRLLYPKGPHGEWTPWLAAVVLMATTAVALEAWQAEPARQSSATETQAGGAAASPYAKWLNEDVVYIIEGPERAAFEKLKTDEERNKFIEQFWLRRDPTPDTAENEFKEEHYRRIAYANEHYRTVAGKPGWQTDRGHVYIVYGPPDEIESHPSGPPRMPYPFEEWKYNHVEGIGDNLTVTFVDRMRTGDYNVAPGNAH